MVQITTSAQAAQRDASAISSGMESWTLMQKAGGAAAALIINQYSSELTDGALVYAGAGNNGGDAYVVATHLVEAGMRVAVRAVREPNTTDAKRALLLYQSAVSTRERMTSASGGGSDVPDAVCRVIIDGILGTGQRGELRDAERAACRAINAQVQAVGGVVVIALDVPTGINATSGDVAADAVCATHTISFGTMKRAHVLQRGAIGTVTVVDIGLGEFGNTPDGAWTLADQQLVRSLLPRIEWNAYKGTRGRIALVGGSEGMAGAVVIASRAALRAGAGLVYTHTAAASMRALQIAEPQVVADAWPAVPADVHAAGIGPGLGRDARSLKILNAALDATTGVPIVLDADALTLMATQSDGAEDDLGEDLDVLSTSKMTIARLAQITSTRSVLCTPHLGEFARLIGEKPAATLEGRVVQATAFASASGATILLKGSPTLVVSPDGFAPVIVPRGNAVLATGGSGDLLTGLITALIGQGAAPRDAGIMGAWVHGRAAEIAAQESGTIRGVTLDDVLHKLPEVWRELRVPVTHPLQTLATLPSVLV